MTRKHLLAVATLATAAFSSTAFAGGEFDPLASYALPATPSTLTRAEVKAQTAAAIRDGSIRDHDDLYGHAPVKRTPSAVTRAEVKAEAQAALRSQRQRPTVEGS